MIKKKTLTPILLGGIFVLMLGLSFAAVPLYDMFCRITGFGGTTQVSKEAPNIVLDKVVSVRFDTNVNNLTWDFKAKSNVIDNEFSICFIKSSFQLSLYSCHEPRDIKTKIMK